VAAQKKFGSVAKTPHIPRRGDWRPIQSEQCAKDVSRRADGREADRDPCRGPSEISEQTSTAGATVWQWQRRHAHWKQLETENAPLKDSRARARDPWSAKRKQLSAQYPRYGPSPHPHLPCARRLSDEPWPGARTGAALPLSARPQAACGANEVLVLRLLNRRRTPAYAF
jgi:hypothetical protein